MGTAPSPKQYCHSLQGDAHPLSASWPDDILSTSPCFLFSITPHSRAASARATSSGDGPSYTTPPACQVLIMLILLPAIYDTRELHLLVCQLPSPGRHKCSRMARPRFVTTPHPACMQRAQKRPLLVARRAYRCRQWTAALAAGGHARLAYPYTLGLGCCTSPGRA